MTINDELLSRIPDETEVMITLLAIGVLVFAGLIYWMIRAYRAERKLQQIMAISTFTPTNDGTARKKH